MPFVQNCWLRRCFLAWSREVKRTKSSNAKEFLTKQLYFADEVFLRCFVHSHAACVKASSNISLCFLKPENSGPIPLDLFLENQRNSLDSASKEIQALRSYIVECAWQACVIMAERENIFLLSHPSEVEGVLYSDMAVWKRKLLRYAKFLHLLDYVLLEFGFGLVMNALRRLSSYILESEKAGISDDESFKQLKTAIISVKLVLEPPKDREKPDESQLEDGEGIVEEEPMLTNMPSPEPGGYAYEYRYEFPKTQKTEEISFKNTILLDKGIYQKMCELVFVYSHEAFSFATENKCSWELQFY